MLRLLAVESTEKTLRLKACKLTVKGGFSYSPITQRFSNLCCCLLQGHDEECRYAKSYRRHRGGAGGLWRQPDKPRLYRATQSSARFSCPHCLQRAAVKAACFIKAVLQPKQITVTSPRAALASLEATLPNLRVVNTMRTYQLRCTQHGMIEPEGTSPSPRAAKNKTDF